MQLLYGNDGTNYHTIAKSKNMTDMQERELLSGYLGYDFVENSAIYSSVENEPISITYVTTDLSHVLPEEKILLCINGHMSNYLTPSYWAHFQLLDVTQESFAEDFYRLLSYKFIKDVDLNSYLSKEIDSFDGKPEILREISDNALDKEAVFIILAKLLSVVDTLSKQVNVILDVEGDAYNKRALEVIATVYKYLPYNIRKMAGFCTYAKNGGDSNRAKIRMFTRERFRTLKEDALDLANIHGQNTLEGISREYVLFAKALVDMSDDERNNWFQLFQQAFETATVSVDEHILLFKNAMHWKKQELASEIDNLAQYAYSAYTTKKQLLVFAVFRKIINQKFVEEKFELQYLEKVQESLYRQRGFQFDRMLCAYLVLGDALPCIKFDEEMFLAWAKSVLEHLANQYEEEMLIEQYKKCYMQLSNIEITGEKLSPIFVRMGELIRNEVQAVKNEILRRTNEEKEKIITMFEQKYFVLAPDDKILLPRIYNGIKYERNYEVFAEMVAKSIKTYLSRLSIFRNYKSYEEYKVFISSLQNYLSVDHIAEISKLLEQKGQKVKEMQKCRQIEWKSRKSILETYQNICMMRCLSQKGDVEVPPYSLKVREHSFSLDENELTALVEFMFCPSAGNLRKAKDVLLLDLKFLECLMSIEAFTEEHFAFLLDWWPYEKKNVIAYYLKSPRLLSQKQIIEGITGIDATEEIFQEYVNSEGELNILGMVLEQKNRNKKQAKIEKPIIRKNKKKKFDIRIFIFPALFVLIVVLLVVVLKMVL